MSWSVQGADLATARMFNATLGAAALAALDELGLLGQIARTGRLDLDAASDEQGLHAPSLRALVYSAACAEVLTLTPDGRVATPGPLFDAVLRDKGYFLWLVRGYGHLLHNLAGATRQAGRVGDFVERDGGMVALAGRDYGARFVDGHFSELLGPARVRAAADLGCGSAERLIRMAHAAPEFRGVGIELNSQAVEVAREATRQAGVGDRVTIRQANVGHLEPDPAFAEVELVFSFFIGHDLWPPREACIAAFEGIATAFPAAQRFLFCDTWRSGREPSRDLPIFTLGFELTHAVMGQYVPTLDEWESLFRETPWTCVERRPIGIPFSTLFDLRRG